MLSQKDLEKIKNETVDFFGKMTFDIEVESLEQKDGVVSINIKTIEPQILIGENGQTLNEIQHLLKIVLRRKMQTEERFFLDFDISNYKKKKNDYLKEMAKSAADEVALSGRGKTLPAMSAYERRVVHTELSGRSDVVTESVGEEPERKIVVKPSF